MSAVRRIRGRKALAPLLGAAGMLLASVSYAHAVGCAVALLERESAGTPAPLTALARLSQAVERPFSAVEECPLGAPEVSALRLETNPKDPLCVVAVFETAEPATPRVVVSGPEGAWTVPASGILTPAPGREHRAAVLGLLPETPYAISVSALGPMGKASAAKSAEFTPPPLPADFPAFETAIAKPGRTAPGVTVFNLTRHTGNPASDLPWSWIVAVDDAGRVVRLLRAEPGVSDVVRFKNGNLAYLSFDPATRATSLQELGLLGNTLRRWTSADLGVDSLHHHVEELPNGNLVVLSNELRAVGGYPEDFPHCPGGVCDVAGDKLVEFTREGEVVREWSLFDVLDPHRIGEDFHLRLWDGLYQGRITKDWTHANAVVHDPRDDSFVVSSRNLDLVFKMSRATGALLWVLHFPDPETPGDDGWPFLRPDMTKPGRLPSRQHAPSLLPGGKLLLYDNGNARGVTSVVQYGIDEAAGTVSFDWHWEDPDYSPKLFAPFVGDADPLPNGNLLVADGALLLDPENPRSRNWARLVELVPETGEKVFEMKIRDPAPSNPTGYTLYRAQRMSLYPESGG